MNVINPRYYVMSVEYSIPAQAENRTQPRAYDSLNDAVARLHEVMRNDMTNTDLAWAVCYIMDNFGNTLRSERYVKDHYLDPDPEPEPEVTEPTETTEE